jgi:signal transduction histidine kinase
MNADPVLLRRVIDNLLENAHKYTDKPDRPITLQAKVEGERAIIDVIDRGIGISEEDQKRLFEPFFRVDRSRARSTGGLGLGLLLARRIVEAHGGTLTMASVLNEGTTATVTLPITT